MGDALLTYENEAYFTNLVVPEKDRLPYIVPDNNIRVSPPPPTMHRRAHPRVSGCPPVHAACHAASTFPADRQCIGQGGKAVCAL